MTRNTQSSIAAFTGSTQSQAPLGGPVSLPTPSFNDDDLAGLFNDDGALRPAGKTGGFTVTDSQHTRTRHVPDHIDNSIPSIDPFGGADSWSRSDDDDDDGQRIDECPKCGAENVSARTEIKQLRAADESGTQLTHTGCGCTIRRDD